MMEHVADSESDHGGWECMVILCNFLIFPLYIYYKPRIGLGLFQWEKLYKCSGGTKEQPTINEKLPVTSERQFKQSGMLFVTFEILAWCIWQKSFHFVILQTMMLQCNPSSLRIWAKPGGEKLQTALGCPLCHGTLAECPL